MKRIVAAVDLSDPSLRAVDLAADLASKYDAELVLLAVGHVVTVGPELGIINESMIESMRDGLAPVRDRAAAKGARRISTEVFVGDPAEQILSCANAPQADLIAIGSRGHSRLSGLLLGSVAQKVVSLARGAVLVVH